MTRWHVDLPARPPAVAGMFYPADAQSMKCMVDPWCAGPEPQRQAWRAALVPHAGWFYSGRIATAVLRRIAMPRTILILCPKHRAGGAQCAVAPWQQWLFPGGSLETDAELSERLAAEIPALELDDVPHRDEHAIEVQLPLLARFAPGCRIAGVTIGRIEWEDCQAIATGLAAIVRDQLDDLLLLISSDMHHFAEDAENRRRDELALQALEQLDPRQLHDACYQQRITMCGVLPAVIVLSALRELGALRHAVRVDYATSAEASGDKQRVVGYAGMLFG